MNRQRFDMGTPEKKKSSRWPFVLLDIWLLVGLVIGYSVHDGTAFVLLCIIVGLLTITHMILAFR